MFAIHPQVTVRAIRNGNSMVSECPYCDHKTVIGLKKGTSLKEGIKTNRCSHWVFTRGLTSHVYGDK